MIRSAINHDTQLCLCANFYYAQMQCDLGQKAGQLVLHHKSIPATLAYAPAPRQRTALVGSVEQAQWDLGQNSGQFALHQSSIPGTPACDAIPRHFSFSGLVGPSVFIIAVVFVPITVISVCCLAVVSFGSDVTFVVVAFFGGVCVTWEEDTDRGSVRGAVKAGLVTLPVGCGPSAPSMRTSAQFTNVSFKETL